MKMQSRIKRCKDPARDSCNCCYLGFLYFSKSQEKNHEENISRVCNYIKHSCISSSIFIQILRFSCIWSYLKEAYSVLVQFCKGKYEHGALWIDSGCTIQGRAQKSDRKFLKTWLRLRTEIHEFIKFALYCLGVAGISCKISLVREVLDL